MRGQRKVPEKQTHGHFFVKDNVGLWACTCGEMRDKYGQPLQLPRKIKA